MPTLDEMMADLEAADTAGDEELARAIVAKIKSARAFEQPSAAGKAAKYAGETAADLAQQYGSLGGAFNVAKGAIGALGSYLVPYTSRPGATLRERFENEMANAARATAEAGRRSPVAAPVGTMLSAAVLPLPAPASRILATASPAVRAGAGLADASLISGLMAAGQNIGTEGGYERTAEVMTSPANLVGAVPEVLRQGIPMARRAAGQLGRALLPRVTPTPEAQGLMAQGVKLTTGQMAPESAVGRIEAASSKMPLGMEPERLAAQEQYRNLVLARPVKRGEPPLPKGSVGEALSEAYARFKPQYGEIKSWPMPAYVADDLAQAMKYQPRGIDARTRAAAQAEIDNALTVLPKNKKLDAGDLIEVRSHLRAQKSSAIRAQDFDRRRVLQHAEDKVSGILGKNLPKEAAQSLREIDRRYAVYNTIENAAARAGLSGEFTPGQLGTALKQSIGKRSFAQGGGLDLRKLAEQGEEVFRQRVPPTGVTGTILGMAPKSLQVSLMRAANTPSIQAAMLRQQQAVGPMLQPQPGQIGPAQAAIMARLLLRRSPRLEVGLVPGLAEEDTGVAP